MDAGFTELLIISLTIGKLLELVKYLRNWRTERDSALTLLAAMVVGCIVITVAAHAKLTEALILPPTTLPLGTLDWLSLILLGICATSLVSWAYDAKRAIDNGDSARQPSLFGPRNVKRDDR